MKEMENTQVWSLCQENLLEQEKAPHSSILALKISWTEEPAMLQSMSPKESDTTEWLSTVCVCVCVCVWNQDSIILLETDCADIKFCDL